MYVIKRTVTYAGGDTFSNYYVDNSSLGEEFSTKLSDAQKFATKPEAELVMNSLSAARRKTALLAVLPISA